MKIQKDFEKVCYNFETQSHNIIQCHIVKAKKWVIEIFNTAKFIHEKKKKSFFENQNHEFNKSAQEDEND